MKVSIKSLVEQVVKEEVSKLAEAKLDPKADKEINTLIKVANILIEKGLDSDGDPLGVLVGPAGTWEEPFTYKPIVRKGNKITFITNSPHTNGGKDQVDVEPIDSSELDGTVIQLKDIIKAYKKAYKKAGIPLPTNTNEATTTMVTPDGKTLSPEQKAKMKMAKPGTTLVVKKAGELSEDIYNDVLAAKGKTINVTLEDGTKVSLKVTKADTVDGEYSADNGDIISVPSRSSTDFGKKSKFYFKPKGERGLARVIKSANDEESKKLLQALFIMTKKESEGNRVPAGKEFTKWSGLKEGQDLQEKKAKESEEEAPAENPEAPAAEAPVEDQTAGTASSELNQHISAAIDSAAKAIEASQDAKYEKVLGKVIKNLTAAQASLADVEAVENKLNEQIAKDEEKSADKFRKSLRKELKGSFKIPEHIDIILKKYDKVAKTASKENRPVQKIAEIITKHALNEGLVKKGDMIA